MDYIYHFGKAVSHYGKGKYEEAIPHFKRVIELFPKEGEPVNPFSLVQMKEGPFITLIFAHTFLSEILKEQGDTRQAIDNLEKAIELKPQDASLYNSIGTILYEQDKFEDSLEYCQKALSCEPKYWQPRLLANLMKGNAQLILGNVIQSIEAYINALEIDSDMDVIHRNLGNLYHNQENFKEAIKHYDVYLLNNKKDQKILSLRAIALQQQKVDLLENISIIIN